MSKGTRKKKDCFGCRAYWYDGFRGYCQLHYKVEDVPSIGVRYLTKPLEICPKPRTDRDLARAEVK